MDGLRKSLIDSGANDPVERVLELHRLEKQELTVAFSGGLDSTVLLHSLVRFRQKLSAADAQRTVEFRSVSSVNAVHIHHGLSPNADLWAAHCVRTADNLGVSLTVVHVEVDASSGKGIEDAARKVRLSALLTHASGLLCMAHHADDQAETVLHNLLRGTGLRGAAGMPVFHHRIFRPFLGLRKEKLRAYAVKNKLQWIEDESNQDRYFTRNFIRHEVLPSLSERFPRCSEQISNAARRFSEAQLLLDELALIDLGKVQFIFPVEVSLIRRLSELRAKNLLRSLLSGHQVQPPDERRLNEFIRQIFTAARDRHPCLDMLAYRLWVSHGWLHFEKISS
ncbi:MAG: tRNA lysidine(34) synthetase TilS [Rugosibacter sp.]|nr:tRNA lysidine(34) synthetase TilS [Rugosibacter sp.]